MGNQAARQALAKARDPDFDCKEMAQDYLTRLKWASDEDLEKFRKDFEVELSLAEAANQEEDEEEQDPNWSHQFVDATNYMKMAHEADTQQYFAEKAKSYWQTGFQNS